MTPRRAYSDDGETAVRLVLVAAAAAAGAIAAVWSKRRRVCFIIGPL